MSHVAYTQNALEKYGGILSVTGRFWRSKFSILKWSCLQVFPALNRQTTGAPRAMVLC